MATITRVRFLAGWLAFTAEATSRNECSEGRENCQKTAIGNMLFQTHVKSHEFKATDAPLYTYGLGPAGTGECPEGMERVLDQEECKTYAESQTPAWAYAGANCFQMNEGCLNNTGNIYFSTCNYTAIDAHHSAVCRRKAVVAASTNMTHIAPNTTAESNTTSNATGTSAAESTNASATNTTSVATNATAPQAETQTVYLNWHRRRTGASRRRHEACDTVSEDYTCPTTVPLSGESEKSFNVTRNGSNVCIISIPDSGWNFNVSVECTKATEAAAAGGNTATEQLFNVLDTDQDGAVSKEEFTHSFSG